MTMPVPIPVVLCRVYSSGILLRNVYFFESSVLLRAQKLPRLEGDFGAFLQASFLFEVALSFEKDISVILGVIVHRAFLRNLDRDKQKNKEAERNWALRIRIASNSFDFVCW